MVQDEDDVDKLSEVDNLSYLFPTQTPLRVLNDVGSLSVQGKKSVGQCIDTLTGYPRLLVEGG